MLTYYFVFGFHQPVNILLELSELCTWCSVHSRIS